ncbi:PhzF family phenazine biosynthesis isomerase [Konateibacter massiliensis]|uniref:PhzF family phenazine biosynthesis isomerase n=1 Tax=Konateibacter massiliensis TaxID=2002841 RepID=UPI002F41B662
MKKYRVYQVDSFTRQRFHGNPAGVVSNADGLTEDQMQRIARELNNSETAFIFSPNSDDHDVEVRFFTPTTEVPLCGHATIAAHYVR